MWNIFKQKIVIYGKWKAMQSLCALLDHLHITYVQMDDQDTDLDQIKKSHIIIATPGIKPSHRLYEQYSKKILSELSFLWKLQQEGIFSWWDRLRIIGITATNGKSTTTRVLYQALMLLQSQWVLSSKTHIHLGGNYDVPLSGILLEIMQNNQTDADHVIVLECSSFMLWKLQYFTFDIGLLLNIAPDHIDRHGSMKDYLQAKVNILTNATYAITTSVIQQDILKDQMRGISLLHRLRPFGTTNRDPHQRHLYSPLYPWQHPLFMGDHNAFNFWAVDVVLQYLYNDRYDRQILQQVQPVPHRLQPILLSDGITIIDDSVSSSAHALRAAIDAMTEPVVLISWWYDNGEDYQDLTPKLATHVQIAIFYGQTRALLYPLAKPSVEKVIMVETLWEAISQAIEECKKNSLTTILYSPWAKSFDQFDNVYHRIRVFGEEIGKIKNKWP